MFHFSRFFSNAHLAENLANAASAGWDPEHTADEDTWDEDSQAADPLSFAHILFTGFDLPAFAQELATLQDGLPLPQIFCWQESPIFAEVNPASWPTADKRALEAFSQILENQRKSGKYFATVQEILERNPNQGLAVLMMEYIGQWHPELLQPWSQTQLERHADWHVLRFLTAGKWLRQQDLSGPVSEEQQQTYKAWMFDKHELHEYLEPEKIDAWTAMAFYQTQACWFLVGDFQAARALYAINLCAQIERQAELNEEWDDFELPVTDELLRFWLFKNTEATYEQMQHFLKPLMSRKLADLAKRK